MAHKLRGKTMDVFEEVNRLAESVVDGFLIEPGMEVNHDQHVVVAGVMLHSLGFDVPIFISVDELRRMADEAERVARESLHTRIEE